MPFIQPHTAKDGSTSKALLMNSERLLRHYPELQDLPRETQRALIEKAQIETFGQEQKLYNWRRHLVTFAVIVALSLFIILILGPALGLSDGAVAGLMMVVVLPLFIYIQHRRYIAQLRPAVMEQLVRYKDKKAPR
jgi:hypothetical protein